MYFPGEHKLARFSGETRKANIKIHTHTKETYQNIQNNLFYFLKAERSLLTLPFPFISFESINSEKNGFCRHPYQLVDWESGSAGSNLRAGRELMKPKEVAERRLSLLSLGSLLYYERSSQSFFNELQSCFSLTFLRGRKAPCMGERSNLHLGVISYFSFTSEVCSLPLATYLSSSGHKKWTTENVPLNGMLL